MKKYKIFAINPGSTSTKIALFENDKVIFSKNVSHDAEKLKEFKEISDQFPYRKETILNELAKVGLSLKDVDAFSGRGGGTVSLEGGVYEVNETMLDDTRSGKYVKHPANLGSQLADEFAKEYGGKAVVVNPPDVDEFQDLARVTGLRGVYRQSKIHALNQKEIGIRYGKSIKKSYEGLNLIIAHIGGGVSVTAHKKGNMIDSNDIVNGDGPMAPTRAGQVPATNLIKICFSGQYTEEELYKIITKEGGLVNQLGTSDAREVTKRIEDGDTYAKLVYDAMIYQIGKAIGSYSAALHGKVDAIIFTGGISNDKYLVEKLSEMVEYIAPIIVMPGEFEMEALASGAYRVLSGQEEAKIYTGRPVWEGF
ncbi:butyrate kinase [Wukongibacter sp. M2B1]|uniref:butyrate kinase n=1 Tax=Wukongibacter sp. M2B1 TaxID=3088895 RepID=UPI003D7AFC42